MDLSLRQTARRDRIARARSPLRIPSRQSDPFRLETSQVRARLVIDIYTGRILMLIT
jgi:hypothetical protein